MTASPASKNVRGAATLSADVTSAIMEAALTDLAEKGLAGMSMEGVARRAGVGKSAIYRRWSSKEQMTASILREVSWARDSDIPDTGSLRDDLRQVALDFLAWMTDDPRVGQIFLAMLAEGRRSKKLGEVLSAEIDSPRRSRVSRVFDNAVDRGEISAIYDRELAMDMIGGTIFWHQLSRRLDVGPDYIDGLLDVLETGWRSDR
jgi:AcrR family transcriptional regulator